MSRQPRPAPPSESRGKLSRSNRTIIFVFLASVILIGGISFYVALFTDWRDESIDAVTTETAEVYNTAAAGSTATVSAIMTATAVAGEPTEQAATPAAEADVVSVSTVPAENPSQ